MRSLAETLCNWIGRSPAGPLTQRAIARCAESGAIPRNLLASAAMNVASSERAASIRRRVRLPDGSYVNLECDLRYQAYRELVLGTDDYSNDLSIRLFGRLVRDADLCLDIGANAGVFAYVAAIASPTARIVALEPIPRLAELLRRNSIGNGWSSRLTVCRAVAGDRPGKARFFILASDTESTLDSARASRGVVRDELDVDVLLVDDLLNELRYDPSRTVIKMDVEGHERSVLAGMRRTLAETPAPDLIIELLGAAVERGAIEEMIAEGFAIHYIGPDRLTRLETRADFAARQDLRCWNFYCTRRPEREVETILREMEPASI